MEEKTSYLVDQYSSDLTSALQNKSDTDYAISKYSQHLIRSTQNDDTSKYTPHNTSYASSYNVSSENIIIDSSTHNENISTDKTFSQYDLSNIENDPKYATKQIKQVSDVRNFKSETNKYEELSRKYLSSKIDNKILVDSGTQTDLTPEHEDNSKLTIDKISGIKSKAKSVKQSVRRKSIRKSTKVVDSDNSYLKEKVCLLYIVIC